MEVIKTRFSKGDTVTIRPDLMEMQKEGKIKLFPDQLRAMGRTGVVSFVGSDEPIHYWVSGMGATPFTEEMLIEGAVDDADRPPYEKHIIEMMDMQVTKGVDKYGVTLDENKTLCSQQRVEHLQEELIDVLQYCEHLKAVMADKLTANDYQRMAMRTAGEVPEEYLDNAILGLCGEVGEVADIIKKHRHQGHDLNVEQLVDELGDVQWYVQLMATALDMSLEDIMLHNIDKLRKRYPKGFDKARSINRPEASDK